ncbi:hypothetical protein C8Q76DRAFT_245769 [Earliella scabrosa]|nr:hypothetical protein C8Q76DRAFT_245769 [Earliella scabrosa]
MRWPVLGVGSSTSKLPRLSSTATASVGLDTVLLPAVSSSIQRECSLSDMASVVDDILSSRYSCAHCGNDYPSAPDLEQHYWQSPDHQPYCRYCDFHLDTDWVEPNSTIMDHYSCNHYWCDTCGQPFETDEQFELHLIFRWPPFHWHCAHCKQDFPSNASLKAHEKTTKHSCNKCAREFPSALALEDHYMQMFLHRYCEYCDPGDAHPDICAQYTIILGATVARRRSKPLWHIKEHFVQSPRHAYCQRCNRHYPSTALLIEHYATYHYFCDICTKVFDFGHGLHEHRRQKHGDRYCVPCQYLFDDLEELDLHRDLNHPRVVLHSATTHEMESSASVGAPLKCSTDPSRHSFRSIGSGAHGAGPYRCLTAVGVGCGAEFASLDALWQHLGDESCSVRRSLAQNGMDVADLLASRIRILAAS